MAAAATLLIMAAAPASAQQQTVSLKLGEAVTLTIDDGGRVIEARRGPAAALSPFEREWARHASRGEYDWASGATAMAIPSGEDGIPAAPQVQAGELRIKFVPLPGDHSMLVLENGYPNAVKYRARIHRAGAEGATDVCEALPDKFGLEHWPYPIERIDLHGFTFRPWIGDREPVCE
jgi:hypothetical protein